MKNKRTVILCLCGTIMIGVIGYSIFKGDDFFPKTNLWSKENKTVEKKDIPTDTLENKGFEEDKTVTMKEEVTTEGLSYIVNDFKITKERGELLNLKKIDAYPPNIEMNSNGDIINDSSYAIVDITIKNNNTDAKEIYLNSNRITFVDKEGNDVCENEAFLTNETEGYEKKDYFRKEIKPGEEIKTSIVYMPKDENLNNNNIIFRIDNHGIVGNTKNTRYVRLK